MLQCQPENTRKLIRLSTITNGKPFDYIIDTVKVSSNSLIKSHLMVLSAARQIPPGAFHKLIFAVLKNAIYTYVKPE